MPNAKKSKKSKKSKSTKKKSSKKAAKKSGKKKKSGKSRRKTTRKASAKASAGTAKAKVSGTMDMPGRACCGLVWDPVRHVFWLADSETERLYRIDPKTGESDEEIRCPGARSGLAMHEDILFQVAGEPKVIRQIEPDGGRARAQLRLSPQTEDLYGVAWRLGPDGNELWITLQNQGILRHLNDSNGKGHRDIQISRSAAGITGADGKIWYVDPGEHALVCVDPDKGDGEEVERRELDGSPADITWDGKTFWICDGLDCTVSKVKP